MVDTLPLPLTRASTSASWLTWETNAQRTDHCEPLLNSLLPPHRHPRPPRSARPARTPGRRALKSSPNGTTCALVFLGDFVDRGPDVPGTIDLVLELLDRALGGSAVLGNHDLALAREPGARRRTPLPLLGNRYSIDYDHYHHLQGLPRTGSRLRTPEHWPAKLEASQQAIPRSSSPTSSPRSPGSSRPPAISSCTAASRPSCRPTPSTQLAALHARRWLRERDSVPCPGTDTDASSGSPNTPSGSARTGSSRSTPSLSPARSRSQATSRSRSPGHQSVRIRLDTSGGYQPPPPHRLPAA